MSASCSECGLTFEPEAGYFAGAMYISYAMSVALSAPLTLWLLMLSFPAWAIIALTALELALLLPPVFRYSRVMWLHIDQIFSPR